MQVCTRNCIAMCLLCLLSDGLQTVYILSCLSEAGHQLSNLRRPAISQVCLLKASTFIRVFDCCLVTLCCDVVPGIADRGGREGPLMLRTEIRCSGCNKRSDKDKGHKYAVSETEYLCQSCYDTHRHADEVFSHWSNAGLRSSLPIVTIVPCCCPVHGRRRERSRCCQWR